MKESDNRVSSQTITSLPSVQGGGAVHGTERRAGDIGREARKLFLAVLIVGTILILIPALGTLIDLVRESGRQQNTSDFVLASIVGTQLKLPTELSFSKLKVRNRSIAILPDCNTCSLTPSGSLKIPNLDHVNAFVTPDKSNVSLFDKRRVRDPLTRPVIVDFKRRLVPEAIYEIAPVVLVVDTNDRVIRGYLPQ